jgi:hypothetical protein
VRFPGFIGPSYTLQSVNVDCQRCVNLYPEMDESQGGDEGEVASLVSTPGLSLLATLPTGPVRNTFTDSSGQLWAVGGNVLYQVANDWTYTAIGTLNTALGNVSLADNGLQVVLVDGASGYSYDIATQVFAQITDPNFLGADQVSFMDGYFIFNKPGTNQFYLSPLNAVTPFDASMIGTAEASPDNIVGHVVIQESLYLFGDQSTEIFYDSGDTFPFARIQGAVMEKGTTSAFSIQKIQDAAYWLAKDLSGQGIVYRGQGLQSQRISTYAIESAISGLDLSSAKAWSYQQAGHSFYCLNIPGTNTTWVFDTTTSLWHERTALAAGVYARHIADCHAFAYDTNVVGDYSNGNLYALDLDTYTDNGSEIVRERTSPHVTKDKNRIFHTRFMVDMETGVGTDSGQGSDPQVMLQWSNDAGHSWSNEHWTSAGAIGARRTRVNFRRLGYARDRVYRVRISDPVKVTLLGAEIEVEEGTS